MSRLSRLARSYASRGHAVTVVGRQYLAVTDCVGGNTYRVTPGGRAIVGTELAALLAAEAEEPPSSGPADGGAYPEWRK